jgi:aspartyl-tRNA(Asn)/glutamyl-tRNA(Gln) amidotransferase subunit A
MMANPKRPEFIYINADTNQKSGSLSGLRLGVKDLFHITGIPTTAGNPDWLTSHSQPAEVTASCVAVLLEAGATLIGKTLTDELAYSLEGVNKHYGTPTNPRSPERIPGGSSSGSAVAVANGSIDIGLGTDTGGSIRVPASYNGLYGFRPSHGAVSCQHLIPLSPRFDTVGWLTDNLANLKIVADVLLKSSKSHQLSHLKVGNLEDLEPWIQLRQPLLEALKDRFESIEYVNLSQRDLKEASRAFRVLQGREIWREHGEWIEQQQPDLATEISDRFYWCKSLSHSDERQAETIAQKFKRFWNTNILPSDESVLMFPTTPGAAPRLNTPALELEQYRSRLMGFTAPAGLTGAPQINLPYLSIEQAPWGISLFSRSGCDRALLDCAFELDDDSLNFYH